MDKVKRQNTSNHLAKLFSTLCLQKSLEKLEVERIPGIGAKTQQILNEEMGILTIGQLARYDVQNLMDRFGKKSGLWMLQVANGKDEDPVIPREDHVSLSAESTFQVSTKDKEVLLKFLLNELVEELYERVNTYGYQFKTVAVKIVRSDFSVVRFIRQIKKGKTKKIVRLFLNLRFLILVMS